jgi:predicted RNA-binding protein YlqC (UPF0109 family)
LPLRRTALREVIELIARELVDDPEGVEVREMEKPGSVTYEIYVTEGDTGKIIGKGGRIISALRTVAKAASVRDGRRIFVEVLD